MIVGRCKFHIGRRVHSISGGNVHNDQFFNHIRMVQSHPDALHDRLGHDPLIEIY